MNEHVSTSPHSYIISYGMSREPFGDDIEDDLFYAEPIRKQKLDILHHLTQYGNELMLVTGPTGSGKTTLLQQFKLHALDTWKVARIDAKNGIDERKLVQQLFHQMSLEFHGATHAELLEQLEHYFDSLQHSARQAVMLLDDAEHMPVTALKCVLMLAGLTSKDNKPLLRIVLFGNDKLEENLADPTLDQYHNVVRRNVDLPAFDSEQTTHYILHRLSAAHFAGNKPFTDAAMQKIHKQSNGWPAEINRLSHNLLVESASSVALHEKNNTSSTFNTPRAIAAAIGITVIGALLLFQDNFNTWLDNSADEIADINLPLALPTTQHAEVQTKEPSPDTPGTLEENITAKTPQSLPADDPAVVLAQMYSNKDADNELNSALRAVNEISKNESSAKITAPTRPATKPNATKPAAIKQLPPATTPTPSTLEAVATKQATSKPVTKKPVSTKQAANKPVTKKPIATKQTASKPVTKKPIATKQAASKPVTKKAATRARPTNTIPADLPGQRAAWILKQNPEHYTLQLVAGNNIKTLRAFVKRYPLTGPLAVYRSTRKGQPWFGLIHGTFSSKQLAIDAGSRLGKKLRRIKPWVRQLEPLQKELR